MSLPSVGGGLEKAYLLFSDGKEVPCMFNPETISISRENNWRPPGTGPFAEEGAPGEGVLQLAYQGAENADLSLTIWFDTTDTGKSVTKYTGVLWSYMEIDPDTEGTPHAAPPTVTFHWGEYLTSFPAVITNLSIKFTYFSSAGTPLRAEVELRLKQYSADNAYGKQNPTSGTPHPHRVHRVQPGETLDRISARYYGDSTRWRALAAANGVEDPLAIRPGALIGIPELGAT
jgi:hypothetical protein